MNLRDRKDKACHFRIRQSCSSQVSLEQATCSPLHLFSSHPPKNQRLIPGQHGLPGPKTKERTSWTQRIKHRTSTDLQPIMLGDAWSLGVSPPVPLPHSGCSVKTKRSFNQLAYALNSAAHVALDLCSLPLKTYSPSPRMTSLGSDTACNKRPVAVAQHAHVTLPAFVVFLQAWD